MPPGHNLQHFSPGSGGCVTPGVFFLYDLLSKWLNKKFDRMHLEKRWLEWKASFHRVTFDS